MKPTICGKTRLTFPYSCIGTYFYGLTSESINQGTDFDLEDGVTVIDKDGNYLTFSVSPDSVDSCTTGDQIFTYTASDGTIATRIITVVAISNPVISGVASTMTVAVGDTVSTLDGVSAVDGNGNSLTVTCAEGSSVTYTEVGSYTLHYTATDDCGNSTTETTAVTVAQGYFVGLTNETINQGTDFDLEEDVTAYDAYGDVQSYTISPGTIDTCTTGAQTFTYTATDGTTGTRTITVDAISDPTIYGTATALTVEEGETFDPLSGVTAEDGNGNNLNVTYTVAEVTTYRTVLYTDGTLIINEASDDIVANVAAHGAPTNVYSPLDANHDYVFSDPTDRPWDNEALDVLSVEIGSAIQPYSTAHWLAELRQCTSIDLTNLDTSNTVEMRYMFYHCNCLTSLDVSNFDTSNVTDMSYMFSDCDSLTTIIASSAFVTTSVISDSDMFSGSINLVGGNGTVYDPYCIDSIYACIDAALTPGYFTSNAYTSLIHIWVRASHTDFDSFDLDLGIETDQGTWDTVALDDGAYDYNVEFSEDRIAYDADSGSITLWYTDSTDTTVTLSNPTASSGTKIYDYNGTDPIKVRVTVYKVPVV